MLPPSSGLNQSFSLLNCFSQIEMHFRPHNFAVSFIKPKRAEYLSWLLQNFSEQLQGQGKPGYVSGRLTKYIMFPHIIQLRVTMFGPITENNIWHHRKTFDQSLKLTDKLHGAESFLRS
jgi:hypothetical protein